MNKKLSRLSSMILLIALFAPALTTTTAGQSSPQSKPKKDKFGSSLKRLKWDARQRVAVEQREAESSKAQDEEEGIKLQTLVVSLDVLVKESKTGRYIRGLKKEDFILTEDGQPQKIDGFAFGNATDRPRTIILIIDYSGSQIPYLETSIEAAKVLVNQLAPQDKMTIITDDVKMLIDFTSNKSDLKTALDELLNQSKNGKRGRSHQFSALLATLKELVDQESRCLIIFQTDGDELHALRDQAKTRSPSSEDGKNEFGLGDIYNAAEQSPATIYTVITNGRLIGIPADDVFKSARKSLERRARLLAKNDVDYRKYMDDHPITDRAIKRWITEREPAQFAAARASYLTGGLTGYLDEPEQASGIYRDILADINNRYLLSYYPTNTKRDGSQRKLRLEVRGHPEYLVHSRKTYLAPNDNPAHAQ
jgi:VWFA-related protein